MGNKSDLINRTQDVVSLISQVISTTKSATGVANAGFRGTLHAINIGNSGDTLSGTVYLTVKLEESATVGGTYTAVVTADCIGQTLVAGVFDTINAPAEDSKNLMVQYIGSMAASRITFTLTGTHTNGIPVGVIALNAGSSFLPI